MKFSIGYQFFDEYENRFAESISTLAPHINEVYFPWIDTATCRTSLINDRGEIKWGAQEKLEKDLALLKKSGIKLNLLLNSNCYGEKSVSIYFQNYICSIIDHIEDIVGSLDWVTTASPFIAKAVKQYFPHVKTRASINMRIGSIDGMEHLSDLFDGFYMQRDYNRNFKKITKLKNWCDLNDKSLHLLANSGCMRFCSAQTFHDNVVAHDLSIAEMANKQDFNAAKCWDFYEKDQNQWKMLRNTWIRPEDLHHYEGIFDVAKLATRMTNRPLSVVNAYINKLYRGNLLDLLEPNHTSLLKDHYVSNTLFPLDWFEKTSECNKDCTTCKYCESIFTHVKRKLCDVAYE